MSENKYGPEAQRELKRKRRDAEGDSSLETNPPGERPLFRYLRSRHISDLRFAVFFSFILLISLILGFRWAYLQEWEHCTIDRTACLSSFHNPALLGASGGAVAAWAVFVSRLYDVARDRLGTVDIFCANIVSICRIIYAADMIRMFSMAYKSLSFAGMSGESRKENYFATIDVSYNQLSALGPMKIDTIMDFYTFLRGARDATLSFNRWTTPDGKINAPYIDDFRRADVVCVAYLLFLSFESAQKACIALLEKTEAKAVNKELKEHFRSAQIPSSLRTALLYKYYYLRMIEKMKIQLLCLLDNTISKDEGEDERRFWIDLRLVGEGLREHRAYTDFQHVWEKL